MFLDGDAWNNSKFINSNSYFSTDYFSVTDPDTNLPIQDNIRRVDGHSKIVGVCFDGYPIYGPYGYTDPLDNTSNVIAMESSYILNATEFSGRPYSYTHVFNYTDKGAQKQVTIGGGAYLDDFSYVNEHGTLDQYNGRYCVTPEYPNGTYAYFTTDTYPYIIGDYSKN